MYIVLPPSLPLTVSPYLRFLIFSRVEFKNEKSPGVAPPVWDPPLELGSAVAPDQITVVEESNEPQELQTQLKLPDQRKDLKVRVTHVISPSSFYVRLTDSDPQLKK